MQDVSVIEISNHRDLPVLCWACCKLTTFAWVSYCILWPPLSECHILFCDHLCLSVILYTVTTLAWVSCCILWPSLSECHAVYCETFAWMSYCILWPPLPECHAVYCDHLCLSAMLYTVTTFAWVSCCILWPPLPECYTIQKNQQLALHSGCARKAVINALVIYLVLGYMVWKLKLLGRMKQQSRS